MVKPKQKRVEEAQEALQLAENSLMQKQQSLQKVFNSNYLVILFPLHNSHTLWVM